MAKTIIRTVCGLPDYMRCGLSVEVEDGVITRIRPGDFPDPADLGVCLKGLATREMVYHPDRLKYPLKRVGERGEGSQHDAKEAVVNLNSVVRFRPWRSDWIGCAAIIDDAKGHGERSVHRDPGRVGEPAPVVDAQLARCTTRF